MCTILFSWKNHPDYPLVLIANRDEFHERATCQAQWWDDHPEVLAGRDLKAGGTWMGVTKSGRFAAVTNYRKFPLEGPFSTSRGDLVKDYLIGDKSPAKYLDWLEQHGQEYEGFNLIFGNTSELYYYGNRGFGKKLEPGIYGLSNALLDTPWFKVKRGKKMFEEKLEAGLRDPQVFFDLMKDNIQSPDDELPETGIGLERERMISCIFIDGENYGTRLTTVVFVDNKKNVSYTEHSYIPPAENHFSFQVK